MEVAYTNGAQSEDLSLQHRLKDLPEEILDLLRIQNEPRFLEKLAVQALKPELTTSLWATFEPFYVDTTARWLTITSNGKQEIRIIGAFARILPLAPHLQVFLERYLTPSTTELDEKTAHPVIECMGEELHTLGLLELQRLLLATFRLLSFDRRTFSKSVPSFRIQNLLTHNDRTVRYLAVRVYCQLLATSDHKLEELIGRYVGAPEDAIMGDYDGSSVDYGFLSLIEERQLTEALHLRERCKDGISTNFKNYHDQLSPLVVRYSNTLLPRPNGIPSCLSKIITTATTSKNQEAFARSLLLPSPILLHGLAGSGKTSLVNDFARELGFDSSMVTLHLNEQTDAKMLIGMYAAGPTPGSFTWRAGVLTTAVQEGRWVFIEDLDRAPNEVISVILPLIERGELLIPSRGETIKAGQGFRLLASIRTSLSVSGEENPLSFHMVGSRLWQRVPVQMPSQDEFREIIDGTHPILHRFLPGIISVFERLYTISHKPSFASRNRTSLGRPVSPRDLLKWCRRLEKLLLSVGAKLGNEPITEATQYEMFLEATDCFSSSLQTQDARKTVISAIAEEMHIDPQRVDHFLTAHTPIYEDSESSITAGRVRLPKRSFGRVTNSSKKSRPFATTTHAKRLLEQVGVAVQMAEPVLLVGETGIGKTTVVQQLADTLEFNLTAVNLSQQSEVGDLLGGFKPVNIRSLAIPLKDEFDELFASTGISATKNQRYLDQLAKCVAKGQWSKASKLWREAPKMFEFILSELLKREATNERSVEQPQKRRKTESKLQMLMELKPRWERFSESLNQFDIQLSGGSKGFAFTFVEGNIVRAARNGDWVLLDEINLASPDTLESIADLLHSGSGSSPSILLSETGEIERVKAHPNFRIFGAMNPATDVGKRDLPLGLRSRFTEIYVDSPDKQLDDLLGVIKAYLRGASRSDDKAAHDVARLYLNTKRLADEKRLVDGANQVPHFSLRTLTRVLSYVTEITPFYGLRRALYEGFAMGFLTLLNSESEKMLIPLINHHLLDSHGNSQALLSQTPRHPDDGRQYVRFLNKNKNRQYWILQGPQTPEIQSHYIMTPFVERNMLNLVRATSTRRFPVLVQGPTSSGKTSMIEYLAKFSGNKFVRINNHEHTDLQEYLGTYVSGSDGQLKFQEGLLVQALRQGHWIVLDELNLAPTDVLEALNRLLDDNRELLIPETQEVVRPHENFMLFATQNPPGLYGGRKTLSRAFRNRFLELHFDDIPEAELDTILTYRCPKVAPSDCNRIVAVYKELSRLRQSNRAFEQKDSFATLRDLFRWALRDADNREQLANNGYMLLAERVRNPEERLAVKEVIERIMKVKIDINVLYDAQLCPEIQSFNATSNTHGVVWTSAMRRLYVLVAHALRSNEPVLLVGETGCGKTTVCQMLADAFGKELPVLNAHQNTETGDLIGAQRPVRNRSAVLEQLKTDLLAALQVVSWNDSSNIELDDLLLVYRGLDASELEQIPTELRQRIDHGQVKVKALFEWSDGPLVQAMKEGQFFLLDEISLADDSVLERLNSVLESHRTMLLAEKGSEDSFIQAVDGFQFFATMNPGGDYGKRELSPALRNRFTEIWVPALSDQEDILHIVQTKLAVGLKQFSLAMVQFAEWFGKTYRSSAATSISVRDVLAWVKFMNTCGSTDPLFAFVHGAALVYVDTLGANPAALLAITPDNLDEQRAKCLHQINILLDADIIPIYQKPIEFMSTERVIRIGDFSLPKGNLSNVDPGYAFDAPTTKQNAMRVIRALQVQKPILIEGSPGVGKTTLIAALARACGKALTRINLSEQTDLMDLFGSDVPVEGAEAGYFAWRDAPFLQAMQKGEWVLLDEMNLASQSVLEGLNACLDHRGEVYISELDQTFKRHPNFCVFAAQNPHHQGGGRKGLPSSFVNRFTVVYADVFRKNDLQLICKHNFPEMEHIVVNNIINFVSQLEQDVVYHRRFGSQGGPWEFNLRDILRWLSLLTTKSSSLTFAAPSDFLNIIFRQRFRSAKDRAELDRVYFQTFGVEVPFRHYYHNYTSEAYQVGIVSLHCDASSQHLNFPLIDLTNRLPELESIMICIQKNLPCILTGASGNGKTSLLQHIAALHGKNLVVFSLNADIDTMDLVGGFEQVDPLRAARAFLQDLSQYFLNPILRELSHQTTTEELRLIELLTTEIIISKSLFDDLAQLLIRISKNTNLPHCLELSKTCEQFALAPMALENARFEWVDGILIKALERGSWLVLDNANLCSASVLDRLNSLLEPDGFLSINEHCGPNGDPKIVKPHPDFRIFLTMDPKFGELSRAMRNRAIEIFLEPLPVDITLKPKSFTRLEASLYRFEYVNRLLEPREFDGGKTKLLQAVAIDNLSLADMPLLARYTSLAQSLLPLDVVDGFASITSTYLNVQQSPSNESFWNGLADMYMKLEGGRSKDAQILHALQNSPIVPLLASGPHRDQPHWMAVVFETLIECQVLIEACRAQEFSLKNIKPSKMNRLQRSLVSARVASVTCDSTVRVSMLIANSLKILTTFVQNRTMPSLPWRQERQSVHLLLRFLWDTYNLATSTSFDESTFQAHLTIGEESMRSLLKLHPNIKDELYPISSMLDILRSDFNPNFKLVTGLTMERLWRQYRPLVGGNDVAQAVLSKMESLADRFDDMRWKSSIIVEEMGSVMTSFAKAYRLVLTSNVDGAGLVKTLTEEIEKLEKGLITEDDVATKPYLSEEFESLRQYHALSFLQLPANRRPQETDTVISVLANESTRCQLRFIAASATSQSLQSVENLLGISETLAPVADNFSTGLLHQLENIGEVNLRSFELLETELPILGQKIAQATTTISQDQLVALNQVLTDLSAEFLQSHVSSTGALFKSILRSEVSSDQDSRLLQLSIENSVPEVLPVFTKHLSPLTVHLMAAQSEAIKKTAEMQHLALAWAHFAIGGVSLYVPDKPYDPDRRQRLEHERYQDLSELLQGKLSALKEFESHFSGQSSNLRCQILEEDIALLKPPLAISQQIYRPGASELDQIHGEFKNLLKVVLGADICGNLQAYFESQQEGKLQEIKLLQSNIRQIIRRLSERFHGYRDLTVPAVGMLRCLQVALYLAVSSAKDSSEKLRATQALCKITPFMGGRKSTAGDILVNSHPMEYLTFVAAQASLDQTTAFNSESRELLLKTFHGCYDQWIERLEADRAEAESKSGLYRFRGSAEDEEEFDQEQFDELFPSYDGESEEKSNCASRAKKVRDIAIALANIHSKIFDNRDTPVKSIEHLIRQVSISIGKLHDTSSFGDGNITKSILAGTLLCLNDRIESLQSPHQLPESYNFYTDSNLPEVRKLVRLVHSIQDRFRQLQAVDEIAHMQPLIDVLTSCHELLAFRHTEPLAKIITKVEKVHVYVHEWQFGGWASRANSALPQYDALTKTIIDWRRLELSTWGKLFDMEQRKCEDDAKSWWFVAYQVVVAAPLQMSNSPENLREYAQNLLKDLETYFSTAVLGQFSQRIALLKQLQKHLELATKDYPDLAIILEALSNFIQMFSRYGRPVQEYLKRGRLSLEKSMRDVLLLASWKDTNIVALRDSAKRSHHKLFKIVRKFRVLLSQSMDTIIKQGLPDETITIGESVNTLAVQFPSVDLTALSRCAEFVPTWQQKSKRFVNVSKTVGLMADASQIPSSIHESTLYVEDFLANIINSAAELQKATPTTLTDDNKVTVKHLKTRKRKLFADTLKDLKQMGIKFNLGSDALARQDSLSVVLSSVGYLKDADTSGLEYYFLKALDLAPRAREAVKQHSEDLSGREVERSTGFLEGLLQILILQHNELSTSVNDLRGLENTIEIAKALWSSDHHANRILSQGSSAAYPVSIKWIPSILGVALNLTQIHARLGKVDSGSVTGTLFQSITEFQTLMDKWNERQLLPDGISSTNNEALRNSINTSIQQLKAICGRIARERPDLAFIVDQILPWIETAPMDYSNTEKQSSIADLDAKLSSVCDAVLVTIERYKKALGDLVKPEDDTWLTKNDKGLSSAIRALRINAITCRINSAFAVLRGLDLDDADCSRTAGALFAVALPILQQYLTTVKESLTCYALLHRSAAKALFVLAKTFIQIATQGFCTPSEESAAEDGKTEKLEGGTGLGEGEGAEDISKDIQDDENLDELAQEPNSGNKGDIEDEQDAVDMADGEMEGEMGEAEEDTEDKEGSGNEDEGEDMDEEAGDVDDLDPKAVDEKMWDGDGEQAEKDQEADDSKGKASKDEQMAAKDDQEQQETSDQEDSGDEEEMAGAEQSEEIKQQDGIEKHDPHADEGEALDLPDDMELDGDGDEKEGSDNDDINDLSDIEERAQDDEVSDGGKDEEDIETTEQHEDQQLGEAMDIVDLDEEDTEEGDKTEEAGEKAEEAPAEESIEDQGLLHDRGDDANADSENAVPSEVQGVGEDQNDNSIDDKTDSASKAQRKEGGQGGESSEQNNDTAEDGESGRRANGEAPQNSQDDTMSSSDAQPFKKLGDALEKWHRQQSQIREPAQQKEPAPEQFESNPNSSEFQHLQDENAEADDQAMGTATEDQVRPLDESMALDPESAEMPDQFQPDEGESDEMTLDGDVVELDEASESIEQESSDAYEGRAGAMIKQAGQDRDDIDDQHSRTQEHIEHEVEQVDQQLDHTHLDTSKTISMRSPAEAREQWTHCEAVTRDLSLSLTEQLRLILAPTLATKMRGDFRTGKRLNIKRIIPYIASQYKRDKIWMRRSVPSKRSYQIMLAVDDSKSMGESGGGSLAFETLVMVAKSLSMLEVGEICVVGFGETVKVAHEFDAPFSGDAGPKIFQQFTFDQPRTDVIKLVRESISLFRTARAKASSSPADLWQLQLIISDGVCDSSEHDPIRRLLREALEERIMMVFVVVDDLKNKKKGESVMDLKEAKFIKDERTGGSVVKIERYLDTFPFQYYLIVSDVKELPGVLAALLRQWFAEVADSS